jgi:hypothetical protein
MALSEMINQRILGYDLRVWPPPVWDEEMRSSFLYRLDAPRILSVDALVWPAPEAREDWLEEHPGGGFLGLYEEAPELDHVAGEGTVVITVSVVEGDWTDAQRAAWDGLALEPVADDYAPIGLRLLDEQPMKEATGVTSFLGFDVADSGLISGLSSCGGVKDCERAAFLDQLNEHHLFDDVEAAQAFRIFADGRVPEHAPFFVYGLWRC